MPDDRVVTAVQVDEVVATVLEEAVGPALDTAEGLVDFVTGHVHDDLIEPYGLHLTGASLESPGQVRFFLSYQLPPDATQATLTSHAPDGMLAPLHPVQALPLPDGSVGPVLEMLGDGPFWVSFTLDAGAAGTYHTGTFVAIDALGLLRVGPEVELPVGMLRGDSTQPIVEPAGLFETITGLLEPQPASQAQSAGCPGSGTFPFHARYTTSGNSSGINPVPNLENEPTPGTNHRDRPVAHMRIEVHAGAFDPAIDPNTYRNQRIAGAYTDLDGRATFQIPAQYCGQPAHLIRWLETTVQGDIRAERMADGSTWWGYSAFDFALADDGEVDLWINMWQSAAAMGFSQLVESHFLVQQEAGVSVTTPLSFRFEHGHDTTHFPAWPNATCGACYVGMDTTGTQRDAILVRSSNHNHMAIWNFFAMYHEYGHHLQVFLTGSMYTPRYSPGNHTFDDHATYTEGPHSVEMVHQTTQSAFVEGWGNFYAAAMRGGGRIHYETYPVGSAGPWVLPDVPTSSVTEFGPSTGGTCRGPFRECVVGYLLWMAYDHQDYDLADLVAPMLDVRNTPAARQLNIHRIMDEVLGADPPQAMLDALAAVGVPRHGDAGSLDDAPNGGAIPLTITPGTYQGSNSYDPSWNPAHGTVVDSTVYTLDMRDFYWVNAGTYLQEVAVTATGMDGARPNIRIWSGPSYNPSQNWVARGLSDANGQASATYVNPGGSCCHVEIYTQPDHQGVYEFQATVTQRTGPAPSASMSSLPSSVPYGGSMTVSATITNNGDVPVYDVVAQLGVPSNSPPWWSTASGSTTKNLGTLEPSESKTAQWQVWPSAAPCGPGHEFTVQATGTGYGTMWQSPIVSDSTSLTCPPGSIFLSSPADGAWVTDSPNSMPFTAYWQHTLGAGMQFSVYAYRPEQGKHYNGLVCGPTVNDKCTFSVSESAFHGVFTLDGPWVLFVEATDPFGTKTESNEANFFLDRRAPNLVGSYSGTFGAEGWHLSPVTVSYVCTDNWYTGSHAFRNGVVDYIEYALNVVFGPDAVYHEYWDSFTIAAEGETRVRALCFDKAGNPAGALQTLTIDTVPPTATADVVGNPGDNGWYKSPVTVTLACMDATSGCAQTTYRLNGGAWTVYDEPFTISVQGQNTLEYQARDWASNEQAVQTRIIRIDTTPPTITLSTPPLVTEGDSFTVSWSAADDHSGYRCATVDMRTDGGPWQPWLDCHPGSSQQFTGPVGHHYAFRAKARDEAGWQSDWTPTKTTLLGRYPVADAGPDLQAPLGQSLYQGVILDGSDSYDEDGTIVQYCWEFGDGWGPACSHEPAARHRYLLPGTYTATLTVIDNTDLLNSDTTDVTISGDHDQQIRWLRAFLVACITDTASGKIQACLPPGVCVGVASQLGEIEECVGDTVCADLGPVLGQLCVQEDVCVQTDPDDPAQWCVVRELWDFLIPDGHSQLVIDDDAALNEPITDAPGQQIFGHATPAKADWYRVFPTTGPHDIQAWYMTRAEWDAGGNPPDLTWAGAAQKPVTAVPNGGGPNGEALLRVQLQYDLEVDFDEEYVVQFVGFHFDGDTIKGTTTSAVHVFTTPPM